MAKTVRQIIRIDEELCNGCGACVPACAEGALQLIDGKARLVSETYCDGLGACIGECPQGAISFESREAEDFDEQAAQERVRASARHEADPEAACGHDHAGAQAAHRQSGFVCPSARVIDRTGEQSPAANTTGRELTPSELRQWPIKLYLIDPSAPYFENAELLIAADCVPFAYGSLHPDFLRGKTLVTGCPKFDDAELYANKLTEIMRRNTIKSVTVLQMEVPCCFGISHLAREAVIASGKDIPIQSVTVSLSGELR